MTKNEIVESGDSNQPLISEAQFRTLQIFLYGEIHHSYRGGKVCAEYRDLHEAWVKFRDLRFDNKEQDMRHDEFCDEIGNMIVFHTITEAFDELCKGIEWYNSLKK